MERGAESYERSAGRGFRRRTGHPGIGREHGHRAGRMGPRDRQRLQYEKRLGDTVRLVERHGLVSRSAADHGRFRRRPAGRRNGFERQRDCGLGSRLGR